MPETNNIIEFPQVPTTGKNSAKSRSKETSKSTQERSTHGAHAWDRLSSPRRTKISWDDRVSIAANIDKEIAKLEITPRELARMSGIDDGPKELYRLRLPYGTDPLKRRLRASPRNYIKLIKSISRITGESLSVLVNRITYGTSIHPSGAKDLREVDIMQAALQQFVNQIDDEFDLFKKFRKTRDIKISSLREGDFNNWPLIGSFDESDMVLRDPVLADLGLTLKSLKLWGFNKEDKKTVKLKDIDTSPFNKDDQRYISDLLREFDRKVDYREMILSGKYSFWSGEGDEEACSFFVNPECALPYVPSAYVGVVIDWPEERGNNELLNDEFRNEQRQGYDSVPTVRISEETGIPYLDNFDYSTSHDYSHAWIIIYPDIKMTTLIPVLLVFSGACGCIGYRLSVAKIVELKEWEVVGSKPITVFQRLVEMLGGGASEQNEIPIINSWREIAPNFDLNPFFLKKKMEAKSKRVFLENLEKILGK